MTSRSDSKPSWLHCNSLYSLAKGVGRCFAQNVVRAVHIRIEEPLARCPVQATFHPSPAEARLLFHFPIGRDCIAVEETGLARVALFLQHHLYSDESGLVAEHVHKARMRELDKVLLVLFAHLRFLLPAGVLADDERADALSHEERDNPLGGGVQVEVNPPSTFGGHALHAVSSAGRS